MTTSTHCCRSSSEKRVVFSRGEKKEKGKRRREVLTSFLFLFLSFSLARLLHLLFVAPPRKKKQEREKENSFSLCLTYPSPLTSGRAFSAPYRCPAVLLRFFRLYYNEKKTQKKISKKQHQEKFPGLLIFFYLNLIITPNVCALRESEGRRRPVAPRALVPRAVCFFRPRLPLFFPRGRGNKKKTSKEISFPFFFPSRFYSDNFENRK